LCGRALADFQPECERAAVYHAAGAGQPRHPRGAPSEPFSERNFIRNTAPPEFGKDLLKVLNADDPSKPQKGNSKAATVQRGAKLFGIDLVAFANRTVGGAMAAGGDGRDDNAINQNDRGLNCVGCHTPIRRTGLSPTDPSNGVSFGVGSANLSFK